MKKFLPTILFYGLSFIAVYVLNLISPDQHDGGPGLGTMVLVIVVLVILVLAIIHLIKGIRTDKYHFVIALIHVLVFVTLVNFLFL